MVSTGRSSGDRDAAIETRASRSRRRLGFLVRDFPWLHLGLGLLGNLLFVIGSVLFFFHHLETSAIWLFVLGSTGMLTGSLGELLVRIEKHRVGAD